MTTSQQQPAAEIRHPEQFQSYLAACANVARITGHGQKPLSYENWTRRIAGAAIETAIETASEPPEEAGTEQSTDDGAVLRAALLYAIMLPGRLLPVIPDDKRPALDGWPAKASRSEGDLKGWFRGYNNIGFTPDAGVFVLDLDFKGSKDGFASLAELEAQFGTLPTTLTATTPTGGEHRYFRGGNRPFKTQANACKIMGVDIRAGSASAGFVVMPPSSRPEGIYAWKNWDMTGPPVIAPAPEWLQQIACGDDPRKKIEQKPVAKRTPQDDDNVDPDRIDHLRDALSYLSADDYDSWIAVGHSLKTLGDDGRELFMTWSATSDQFDKREASAKWDGFGPTETSYRAIFSQAQGEGWINPGSAAPLRPEVIEETGVAAGCLLIKTKDGMAFKASSHMRDIVAPALRDKFAYSQEANTWHEWTGTHWAIDRAGAAYAKRIHDVVSVGTFPKGFSTTHTTAIQNLIRDGQDLPLNTLAGDLLPFRNGLLDLATRELVPVSPRRALTWCLPYDYSESADCPNIKAWLLQAMFGRPEMVEYLRAWMAAILTGRADLQMFFYLKGKGGTGKGTFLRLVSDMVGAHNVFSTNLKQLESNRFEVAGAYGKRLTIIGDAAKYGGGIEVLKQMTGQDALRLERKGIQQEGSFVYGGCVLIASNEDLVTSDLTSGLDRRRAVVEFNRVASAQEKLDWDARGGEIEILRKEMPGLVKWVLGLSPAEVRHAVLHPPEAVAASNKGAMLHNNPVARWLEQCCIPYAGQHTVIGGRSIARSASGRVTFDDAETHLYPNYLAFVEREGIHPLALGRFKATIIDACGTLGYPVERKLKPGDGRDCIKGLMLRIVD